MQQSMKASLCSSASSLKKLLPTTVDKSLYLANIWLVSMEEKQDTSPLQEQIFPSEDKTNTQQDTQVSSFWVRGSSLKVFIQSSYIFPQLYITPVVPSG